MRDYSGAVTDDETNVQTLDSSETSPALRGAAADALFHAAEQRGDMTSALRMARRAVSEFSLLPRYWHNLAAISRELWHLDEMHEALIRKDALTRGRNADTPVQVPKYLHKYEHDIEQLMHLQEEGVVVEGSQELIAALQTVHQGLSSVPHYQDGATLEWQRLQRVLSPVHRKAMAHGLNRAVYVEAAPRLAGRALNPQLDFAAIEREYVGVSPSMTSFDTLLTPEALHSLRRFCLRSTIWYEDKVRYLGSYHWDGFHAPLLHQIASELSEKLPRIFGGHELSTFWAYKYSADFDAGIGVHADTAAVNVNFWLSEDASNLNPDSGGLVVFKREAPASWNFEQFNQGEFSRNTTRFIEVFGNENRTFAHRQNRCVIFNSNLFHTTDVIRFKQGYKHKRINVTFLFGKRKSK